MKKTTLIAIGAFAVLLAVVLATREDDTNVNVGVPKLQLAPLGGEITGVELSGANSLKLTFESGGWKVNGFAADDAQVKVLTDGLKDLRAQDFVTEKTEKHAELEVDDAKGVKVAVTTATGPGWTVVFGKGAKSGGTYVREAKSNAVFTTTSQAAYQVKKKVSDWRKKMVATAPTADVVKVTVTQPAGVLTLVKNGDAWALDPAPPADFKYDAEAAQRLVQAATNVQAQDFGDALGEQAAALELELKDGKKVTLKLGAKKPEGGTVPMTVEGDPQVYVLSQFTAEQLLKGVEDMRNCTLLAFDPAKANKLSVVAGGKTTVLQKTGAEWKVLEPKKLPDGFQLDPGTVTNMLNRLHAMRATRAVLGVTDAAAGLTKPTATVEVQLEDGSKQAIRFGGDTPAKDAHYVKGVDALTYTMGPAQRASFEGGLDMFRQRPPPDMSQIRGLEQLPPEVRRQLEAQLKMQRN